MRGRRPSGHAFLPAVASLALALLAGLPLALAQPTAAMPPNVPLIEGGDYRVLVDPAALPSPVASAETPSASPDPAASPDPGASPDPAASPDPGASPDPAASPDPGASPDPAASPDPDASPDLAASPAALATPPASGVAPPTPTGSGAIPASDPIGYGKDGRFTVLLIGSDWRSHSGGERTDVMLVMSIDPTTGRAAAASVPRDTVFFPRAKSNGGGTSGLTRVNSIYYFYRHPGLKHGAVDKAAMARFMQDMSYTLGIHIDGYAMVRFAGFVSLVNHVQGLTVGIPEAIDDPYYRGIHGLYFPSRDGYWLAGNPPCADKPAKCHSALAYARSRKGTVGSGLNGDFPRARRQQQLVMSAIARVVNHVGTGTPLSALVTLTNGLLWTDLPRTLSAALQLSGLLADASLLPNDTVVFGPRKWAYETPQTPVYTYRLHLDPVRGWIDKHMAPVP